MNSFPNVLLIGSTSKNAGKTLIASKLIKKFRSQTSIIAIKITTVHSPKDGCHCKSKTCNVCTTLKRDYEITREQSFKGKKDTEKLLAAGAQDVYWIKAKKEHVETAFHNLYSALPKDSFIVCESNSLRDHITPGLLVMVRNKIENSIRPSAIHNLNKTDLILYPNELGEKVDDTISRFSIAQNRWAYRFNATANILAGGKSSRFGRDKTKEVIEGKTIIERLFHQLSPYFSNMQLSRAKKGDHLDTNYDIYDEYNEIGPIAGIHSCLKHSETDQNFIVAGDNPEIDIDLMLELMRNLRRFEATIPLKDGEYYEPLFGAYQKRIFPRIERQIRKKNIKIMRALKDVRVEFIAPADSAKLTNINTQQDLQDYLS